MKLVALTSAALLAATTAFAGSYTSTDVIDVPVVEEANTSGGGSLGGSGAWLVPLLAVGLIAIAVMANHEDDEE